jgi:hypothetical protein
VRDGEDRKRFFERVIEVVTLLGGTRPMLPKLALRNARKNVGDFAIYFLTLMLGVAMVYAFGSITAQKVMLDIMKQANTTSQAMGSYMTGLSVFVLFILGFLALYANDFLMKRRGREFGTYLCLDSRSGRSQPDWTSAGTWTSPRSTRSTSPKSRCAMSLPPRRRGRCPATCRSRSSTRVT